MARTKKPARKAREDRTPLCTPVFLPETQLEVAAAEAIALNPANAPPMEAMATVINRLIGEDRADEFYKPEHLAILTGKYWGNKGKKFSVSFMEQTSAELRDRILSHMNAWSVFCNVFFAWSQSSGEVRISRGGGGYWSYLGTDILQIPKSRPTMNLQGFTMSTSESEFKRVVRHETGHTLGCPHEHSRRAIIARLNEQAVIDDFMRTQGWSEQTVRQQILTPIEEASLLSGEPADDESLMAYQFPARLTKDGKPIPGGADFSELDRKVAAKWYPLVVVPPPPPTAGKYRYSIMLEVDESTDTVSVVSLAKS